MAIGARAHARRWSTSSGVRAAGGTLAIACGLLFGCASFVGWLHPDDEPAPAQTAPASGKTAVKKKPAAAAVPEATQKSVEPDAPESAEPSAAEPESQEPERSIFDPY